VSPELDEQYLTWLYARIGNVNETRAAYTFWQLLYFLQHREFVWLVPNDDNRVEDGRDLRLEFLDEAGLSGRVDPNWLGRGCSVLEMIMGVAKRMSFDTDRAPHSCFWEMMNNLGLSGYTDRTFNERRVSDIVENLIWRTYLPDGRGSLFPLRHPKFDQREVEIWYQMSMYILERD
jgi:hypothetical protein